MRGPLAIKYGYGTCVPLAKNVGRRHILFGILAGRTDLSCGMTNPLTGDCGLRAAMAGVPLKLSVTRPPNALVWTHRVSVPRLAGPGILGWSVMVSELHKVVTGTGKLFPFGVVYIVLLNVSSMQYAGPTLKSWMLKVMTVLCTTPAIVAVIVAV